MAREPRRCGQSRLNTCAYRKLLLANCAPIFCFAFIRLALCLDATMRKKGGSKTRRPPIGWPIRRPRASFASNRRISTGKWTTAATALTVHTQVAAFSVVYMIVDSLLGIALVQFCASFALWPRFVAADKLGVEKMHEASGVGRRS